MRFYYLLLIYISTLSFAYSQSIIRVTPSGAGDRSGSSWANALSGTALAGSVATAAAGTQFWVAAGTYKPTTTTDRTASFSIASGVQVYGGFAGMEVALSERVAGANETILSGDLGVPGDRSDNSMNIIQILDTDQAITLSMITVRDGNRLPSESQSEGIGIRVRATGTPTQLYLYSCNFINNRIPSNLNGGGAILFRADAGATCKLIIQDCFFNGNEAGYGGALCLYTVGGNIETNIARSEFVNNIGDEGGAISDKYLEDKQSNSLSINQCKFNNNTANRSGGALNIGHGISLIDKCVFSNNSVAHSTYTRGGGGAVDFSSGHPAFTNCLFTENKAADGGALYSVSEYGTTKIMLTNCTLTNNVATNAGGAIVSKFQYYESNPLGSIYENISIFKNCVVWGNSAPKSNFLYSQSVSMFQTELYASYSDIQGGYSGIGNIDADPTFINPTKDNYQLLANSPAINTGDPNTIDLLPTDLAGQPRVQNGRVDMGAYESACLPMDCVPISVQRKQ